jgi:hypothetical protein
VQNGYAEDRHHGVADELLHRATVDLDDCLHPLEVASEQRAQRIRVEPLPQLRRPLTSQKRTVTTLRCSGEPDSAARAAPHCGQKMKSSALSRPQLEQIGTC